MTRLLIAFISLLILSSCNNAIQNTTSNSGSTEDNSEKEIVGKILKAPFEINCDAPSKFEQFNATDAGFTHERNKNMEYVGEIFFEGKCDNIHYYLFFGLTDPFYPAIDIYEGKSYKDRLHIYEDFGCGYDYGFRQTQNIAFQSNGKIISDIETKVFEIDSVSLETIDSTIKITYDTLILDLKDWCNK